MEENFCIAAFASRLQVMAFEELLKQKGYYYETYCLQNGIEMEVDG